ncbi:Cysteine/Histidine-rich C1 domain family protein [Hirschfeldia incana]|nr:Cysteine/Histidine-rich C1 domain family protein [Hirschfeldia incana]
MGKPTAQNNSFINHFSHPHPLQLIPPTSSPPCSACKLAGGNGRVYSCRPCNFSLHESCSKMKQVITHPSHPSHTLTLLVAPVYEGGYFNCDGCGANGTGFSYQCSLCDFDIHALCAYKPLSIVHQSHPQHSLKLAFHSPYGANKGFSCDICLKIGKNQWLYRCIPCEFDAHIGCVSAHHPHLLQHSNSAPTPLTHHPMPNQGNNRPRPGQMNRPTRPVNNPTRPNRPVGRPMGQNAAVNGPRRQNNNLGFNGSMGLITASDVIGQAVRQSFDQGSMEGSVFDGGSAVNEDFDGEVDVEIEYEANGYEGTEDGEAYDGEQDVDGNGLDIVAYGDDANDVAYSESEFGGSSDARSHQSNDLSDQADLYPLSVRTTRRGPGGGGRKQNSTPNSPVPARSKDMGRNGPRGRLQGSKNPVENSRGPQTRRLQNVRNNAIRAGGPNRPRDLAAFNGPQGFNGPSGGPSNVIDNGGNNDNYNEVDGNEVYAGEYGDTYGDEGDCDFEAGGDFFDDGYDQAYGENDFECYSDITGGSESMYNEDESYETMDDSQYSGLSDEPNNQFLSMGEPVGRPGMNNQNQYGQTDVPRRMVRYGRGGTTNMNRHVNMNQGANSTQPRTMGRSVQRRPNGGQYRANGQPNGQYGGSNGPNGNTMMNTMVQGLCQGLAMNMLSGGGSDVMNMLSGGGGDVNSGAGDSGGSSIIGGLLGGESEF